MSISVDDLAAYLLETHDALGVLEFCRKKWPRSLPTYLSNIKKVWMTENNLHEDYESSFAAALEKAKTAKVPAAALQCMHRFHAMSLSDKNKTQKCMRARCFSGSAEVDALIAALPIFPSYMEKLKVSPEERVATLRKSQQSLQAKSAHSWQIEASATLRKVERILQDDTANAFDLACALSIATGRRMIEIFKTAEFKPKPRQPYCAIFSGQAKKNDVLDSESYMVPLLCKFKDVKDGLARLRKLKPGAALSNTEVNLKWSNSCNVAAKRWLGPERKFHDLRMAYAVIAYHQALPHVWSLNLFVSKVLGHNGLANSLHYTTLHLVNLDEADKRPWAPAAAAATSTVAAAASQK